MRRRNMFTRISKNYTCYAKSFKRSCSTGTVSGTAKTTMWNIFVETVFKTEAIICFYSVNIELKLKPNSTSSMEQYIVK